MRQIIYRITIVSVVLMLLLTLTLLGQARQIKHIEISQASLRHSIIGEDDNENLADIVKLQKETKSSNEAISQETEISKTESVPILYYHSIATEKGNPVRMPADQFDEQMSYLKSNGFTCISLEQLYDSGYLRSKFPSKPIVITLDDGYDDNYTTAYPILKKYGFTASVFMISSYINGDKFMSLAQLKELSNSGWEIEDHTVNHVSLTTVDSNTVINEITKSKEDLEKEIGKPVDFIAYPDGTYNDNIMNLTRNAGYKIAVTTERGYANDSTDPMRIHRVYCYANMGITEFSKRVNNPNY